MAKKNILLTIVVVLLFLLLIDRLYFKNGTFVEESGRALTNNAEPTLSIIEDETTRSSGSNKPDSDLTDELVTPDLVEKFSSRKNRLYLQKCLYDENPFDYSVEPVKIGAFVLKTKIHSTKQLELIEKLKADCLDWSTSFDALSQRIDSY